MDPEEDCTIINLRDARSSCYWFYEGNKKAAKGDGDNIEGNPHEKGDVEAVVLLFHAVISPLSQQCVLDLGQKLDGDVYGAGHKGGEHPHNKHHSPAKDILSKIPSIKFWRQMMKHVIQRFVLTCLNTNLYPLCRSSSTKIEL